MQPDAQAALEEIINGVAGDDKAVGFLPFGFEKNLPVVHVDVTQKEGFPFATHTASLSVYAEDTTEARDLMRTILAYLTVGQHETRAGLIDFVEIDTGAKNQPYADPNVILFTANIRIHTRAQ